MCLHTSECWGSVQYYDNTDKEKYSGGSISCFKHFGLICEIPIA